MVKKNPPAALRPHGVPLQEKKIGLLIAHWHAHITTRLQVAATKYLHEQGITKLIQQQVPGCFELPLVAQLWAQRKDIDGIVALGCILQGETPHFDYICHACAEGLLQVSLRYHKPIGFGVITAHTMEQALARSTQQASNKGREAAAAVVDILALMDKNLP